MVIFTSIVVLQMSNWAKTLELQFCPRTSTQNVEDEQNSYILQKYASIFLSHLFSMANKELTKMIHIGQGL